MDSNNGHCLCGKVKVHASSKQKSVGACHCDICRRWAGGPFMAVDCGTDMAFEGEESIGVYDSSEWAQRGFCKNCGTHLFYRLKQSGQYLMPPGIFDKGGQFVFDHQVFIDEKPAYYSFANETEDMTGAEVFAKYTP